MKIIAYMTVLLLVVPSAAIAAEAAEAERLVGEYEGRVGELESEYGLYHESLLEPLARLAELSRDSGDLERAAEVLGRQLQVTRALYGFHHEGIAPLLRQLATVAQERGDWEGVAEQLGHLRALAAGNSGDAPNPALLQAMNEQLHWHLARLALDADDRRGRRFMAAYRLADDLLDAAEDLYGEGSPQLTPWLYQRALSAYRLVELLNSNQGGLGSDTLDRLVRREGATRLSLLNGSGRYARFGFGASGLGSHYIPVVEPGERLGEAYLRDGLKAMKDIAEIYEGGGDGSGGDSGDGSDSGDKEALAMALIYEGDYHLLMTRGIAFRRYRDGMEMLRQVGIPEADIARYFSRPVPIPVPHFYTSFAEALAAQETFSLDSRFRGNDGAATGNDGAAPAPRHSRVSRFQDRGNPEQEPPALYLGIFTAWEMDAPAVAMPPLLQPGLLDSLQFNQAELSFNVSARGRVTGVKALSSVPDERRVASRARRAARDLTFRPAIVEGRGHRIREARMTYRYLPE